MNGKGYIYFNHGDLCSAVFSDVKGDEAVYGMLMLEDVEIRIKKHLKRKYKKTIETPLLPLLMEGMQHKDEHSSIHKMLRPSPSMKKPPSKGMKSRNQ